MTADDAAPGGARARVRRRLARGARRLQHGRPTLSVVVQVVGADSGHLRETLASVRNQASPKIEILVVGDEAGLALAREVAGDDTRTRFLAAASVHDARALGVREARGSHVILASAGDAYPDDVLAELIDGIQPDRAFLLTAGFAPRVLTSLTETPFGAARPYLGRFLVPAGRAAGAVAGGPDDDPDGFLTGLRLLRGPFRAAGWTSYRNARAAARGPFVARVDAFPGLAARVTRDRATLAELEDLPGVRSARAQGALTDLRPFLDGAEAASDQDWSALVEHAAFLLDAAEEDLVGVPVVGRVLALLAADDRRAEVEQLAALATSDFPTVVRDDRVLAVLPVPDGLLPEDAFEVTAPETWVRARAERLVVDGPVARLELMVGAPHLQQSLSDVVRVQLVTDETARDLRVRLAGDPAVTRWMAETEHDHDAGLVTAEIDVADLQLGMHMIWVLWSDGVRESGTYLTELEPTGSAARAQLPVSDERSVGLHLRHGRVGLGVSGARGEPAGAVNRIEVEDEQLRLTVDPKVDAVVLEGGGRRVEARPGTAGFWTVPLVDAVWGLPAAPLPSGGYRLVLKQGSRAVPATAAPVLMDRLPAEQRTANHRVVLERDEGDTVTVRLEPLLADDELGPYAQRRLQEGFAAVSAPLDPRLVYAQSFTGQGAADNPGPIVAELLRRRPDLDVRWVVADTSAPVPVGATPVLFRSRDWYDVMARATYLVTNVELEDCYVRRPGQQVLQTCHGYPSKAMGLGLWRARGLTPSQVERLLDHSSRVWTTLLTPAEETDGYYRREYAYDGQVLAAGYPRNDALVGPAQADLRAGTRERLGIAEGQQAVLYAPTWRDDLATGFRSAEAAHFLDVEKAAAALGDGYVLLVRGHRFHAPSEREGARVLDVTAYPDVNHLIAAADVAVLDYSSLRFDWALTGKPVVFLVPDLDAYASSTRGFLWDYRETAPGPLVTSTAEVVAELQDPELAARWAADLEAFNARYNRLHDGRATERVVEAFFGF